MVNEKRPSMKSEAVYDALGNVVMRTSVRYKNGKVIEKDLTLDQYLAMLGNSTYAKKASPLIPVGTIPKGYFWGMVSTEGTDTFQVVIVTPAQKRIMSYAGKHWMIPMPALCFKFKVANGILQGKQCFSLNTDMPELSSPLFNYPFGNVSANCGAICFGNIHVAPAHSMGDMELYVDAFFNSVTNNDLYEAGNNNATSYRQDELLTKLKKMESFPVDWLKPCKDYKTMADLCRLKN